MGTSGTAVHGKGPQPGQLHGPDPARQGLHPKVWIGSQNDRMISVCFQGKPFNHSNPSRCPNQYHEEAEVERFYEDLQDLLEHIPKKDVLFITGDCNAKVGSQEAPGVTGKFGLGIWNEAGQRLTEFCQENALVITNTLFQQHKRRLYTWTSPDGQH